MPVHDTVPANADTPCFHCGDTVKRDGVAFDGKVFCCPGCKAVYEILQRNNLCQYYAFDRAPGQIPRPDRHPRFAWLDEPGIAARLMEFSDGETAAVSLFVPGMHCSSCVWLLENLHRVDPGILQSRVDFLKKRITVRFAEGRISLRRIVELLASLGYEPQITLASGEPKVAEPTGRSLYYRVGIAGFSFSNIMLLSFPEYLSGGEVDGGLERVFSLAALVLSLPVFFYSAGVYFLSAYRGLRRRVVNIDVPLALGILVLFARSVWEILGQSGPGFLDSMTGLVFFLLVGRLFQNKTYDSLNFERTYTSYFPLAVMVRRPAGEAAVPVAELAVGERVLIRHDEIVPADAILLKGSGAVDYSFVTGESTPIPRAVGDLVYAGGRQTGGMIELEVVKEVSQSYLTQLWNDASGRSARREGLTRVSNTVARYFTLGVLALAAAAAIYWLPKDARIAVDAVTGILIVACPCALALATPFAYGTVLRILGRNGLYLKNADVTETLARVDTLLFDKTGTLTETRQRDVRFVGAPLDDVHRQMIASVAGSSHHPLSRVVAKHLNGAGFRTPDRFREIPHAGTEGVIDGHTVRLGSGVHVGLAQESGVAETGASLVYAAIDGRVLGHFSITSRYREGVPDLIARLRKRFRLDVLSGDTDRELSQLQATFGADLPVKFRQSPADKLEHVRSIQGEARGVLMVGDGLNDAGALRAADAGIAISDDIAAFSPGCDAILDGRMLHRLDAMLALSRASVMIVLASFAVSLLYNAAVLAIAFRGELSPIIAAVLMPISSVTVVLLATGAVQWAARRKGLL